MEAETCFLRLEQFENPPTLSLTTVRWIEETTTEDEDGDVVVDETAMFDVVGEQYKLQAVNEASDAIANEGSFLPPRFWLFCDKNNPYDANAVSVHAIVGDRAYNVGFLPRSQAALYRESMARLGKPEGTLEVLGCFTQGKTAPHPNARLYLPDDFAALVLQGFSADPANNPGWLSDPTPVAPRPYQGRHARGFSDDELRKIYCFYARKKKWRCFPGACDSAANGFRSSRTSIPVEMDSFVLDPVASPELSKLHDPEPARAFARGHLKRVLMDTMTEEQADAVLRQTDISGRLHGGVGEAYAIYCHRKKPNVTFLCELVVSRTGQGEGDFKVDSIQYHPDWPA